MSALTLHFVGGPLDGLQRPAPEGTDVDAASVAEGYKVHLGPVAGDADPHTVCVPVRWSREEAATELRKRYGRQEVQQGRMSV
jgi:hypothetical protein